MNDDLDLTVIIKDCPQGWKFYSSKYGTVEFFEMNNNRLMFLLDKPTLDSFVVECDGSEVNSRNSRKECIIFPSKEQHDWGQFKKHWLK